MKTFQLLEIYSLALSGTNPFIVFILARELNVRASARMMDAVDLGQEDKNSPAKKLKVSSSNPIENMDCKLSNIHHVLNQKISSNFQVQIQIYFTVISVC